MKLTAKAIAKLAAPTANGKQQLFWDSELKGFGVLCSGVSNAKTYVVQRALPHGQRRRITVGACNVLPLDDARKRAQAILAEFYSGRDPRAGRRDNITLREALERYLAENKSLAPSTRAYYRDIITRYLTDWLDELPLHTVSAEMVVERHNKIAQAVAKAGRNKGHGIANMVIKVLRAIWSHAIDPAKPNPIKQMRRAWFPQQSRTRLVKADDLPAFYAAVCRLQNATARDYVLLMLFTGLRASEAASLRWADIDFTGRVIRIPGERMKAKHPLDLPMTDFVHAMLVARRAVGREEFIFGANSASGHIRNAIFPLRLVAAASGIVISAHDLRRTYITVAESCDISLLALKALVAHTLPHDVTAGYVQMTVERLRAPAQKIADKLKALSGIEAVAGKNVATLAR